MRKVFISQPMNGKTQEDIISARIQAQEIVEKELGEKVEVLDSFFEDFSGDALESFVWDELRKEMGIECESG